VLLTPVHFVLDAVVGKVDLFIEVRQVVFTRPFTNFVFVAVRTAVAVGASAVVFLQKLLVLEAYRDRGRASYVSQATAACS
jgi:hypothetical protein